MTGRPVVALAHAAIGQGHFVTADQLDRLAATAEVLSSTAVTDWADPGEVDLGPVEVVLGHWGIPVLDAAALDRLPALRFLAYAAGSLRGAHPWGPVVSDDLWERGIVVSTGAPANARPVAEFTVAAVLFANKDVFGARERLRPGADRSLWVDRSLTAGNLGKRVGLVGASAVGRLVVELLAPYDLEVVVADPHLDAAEAARLGVRVVGLDELFATSDVVSLHAPLLDTTRGLVDADALGRLRDGAVLVNTARGALVDQDALVAELRTGRISAVLDVTEPERLPRDHPLRTLPNVFLTPHVAGSAGPEIRRLTDFAIGEIERFAAGQPLRNQVRREDLERLA